MSTPTSMTVVDTSTSSSPAVNARMVRSRSAVACLPWTIPMRSPFSGPSASMGVISVTALNPAPASRSPSVLLPEMAGQTTKAWRPCATSSRMRSQARSTQCGLRAVSTKTVFTSARPAGRSRSSMVSRSPKTVMATERGMGVAVITSVWGWCSDFAASAARCSTPKRCCSSTTTKPRSANPTSSDNSAWVPMTIPASPDATVSRARRRLAAVRPPVSSATCVACGWASRVPAAPSPPSSEVMEA